jgi:hypothetical protein
MDSQFHYRKTTNNHPPQSCGLALWTAPPREHNFSVKSHQLPEMGVKKWIGPPAQWILRHPAES